MTDQTRADLLVAEITENLIDLFSISFQHAASNDLQSMLQAFLDHRFDLTFTAHIAASGTILSCCAHPTGGDPIPLFDWHETPPDKKH